MLESLRKFKIMTCLKFSRKTGKNEMIAKIVLRGCKPISVKSYTVNISGPGGHTVPIAKAAIGRA